VPIFLNRVARAAVLRDDRWSWSTTTHKATEPAPTPPNLSTRTRPDVRMPYSSRAPETIRDVIVPGIWPGLDLVPTAGITQGAVRDELVIAGAELARRACRAAEQRSLGVLTPPIPKRVTISDATATATCSSWLDRMA
jgi:hypothetical protein